MRTTNTLLMGAIVLSLQQSILAAEESRPITGEQVCKYLYDSYLQGTRVNSSTINASVDLIADTCRRTRFWHVLLEDVRSGGTHSERYSVRILGKMLQVDAAARDLIETRKRGEPVMSPWIPDIALSSEVVDVLLKRASEVDKWIYHHYVIALVHARDERAHPLFLSILNGISERDRQPSIQFHAAVGLVGLGDPRGVEWLIDQVDERNELTSISSDMPCAVLDNKLPTCSRYALRRIATGALYETKAEWQAWWASRKDSFKPTRNIELFDSNQ